MTDSSKPDSSGGWLNDRIVSGGDGTEPAFRSDGTSFRLDRQDPYLRLQFVSIYVRDQERSLRFFVDQLGFRLVADVRFASGNRWIEVAPPDGTGSLAIVLPIAELGEERMVGHSGLVTFITEDVETKFREWSARGVHFTVPLQTPSWGGIFCRFEDLDGNSFVLAGFDAITQQIEARRRAFAERQEAERRAVQELEIAKQVQARLFPQRLPHVPGLDYAGVCIQARSVGGDYYDFLDLGAGRLALIIGDIAGKGIAAALLMANLQANLRSQCANVVDHPHQILCSVNRLLFENTEPHAYATLFFVEFDHETGRLRYANCGHLSAVLLRNDGSTERMDATCTVVGLFEDWQCVLGASQLGPGDILALYTDGVTECFNQGGEEFGEQRLLAALQHTRCLSAEQMARTVVDEVRAFSTTDQFDDITLIVAKRTRSG